MAKRNKQDEKKAKRLQVILNRIKSAEQWRDNAYQEPWKRYYMQYRNYVAALADKTRSNISVPYSFTMVETILPRLVETIFAARPYVSIKARTRDWTNQADKMETLLDYQQNEVMDIQDIFHIGLKTMAIYGTTVAYTGWKYKERDVKRKELQQVAVPDELGNMVPLFDDMTPDPMTGQPSPVMDYMETDVTEKEYDDPEVKFIDLGLFYVDPNAEDIDDARFCGHVCYMSKDQIQALVDDGYLEDIDWQKVEKGKKQNNARNDRMSAVGLPTVDDNNLEQSQEDDLYECHYYWEDDVSAFIINRSYLARDRENPFWHKQKPYDKDVYSKVPGEFYGIGLMEIIEDQQAELNTERNMRIDYRAHNLRRMFKVRRGSNINPNQMVWKQGGRIEVDNMDDIDVFDPPSISGDTFNQEDIVKSDIRDATGAHDVVMGTASSSETATTTMSKDNNASMRFKLIISSVEKRLLVAITRKMIMLNQQFIDDVRVLPIFDGKTDDWIEIQPEEIQGEFHLIASGSSVEPMANKEAYKQRMVELFSIVMNNPIMQQYPQYIINLLRKVFESFDITDTEGLLPSDDEVMGLADQQVISRFIGSLPPELQQLLGQFMQQPTPQAQGTEPTQIGGGANTAPMQEQGLQLVSGGGAP